MSKRTIVARWNHKQDAQSCIEKTSGLGLKQIHIVAYDDGSIGWSDGDIGQSRKVHLSHYVPCNEYGGLDNPVTLKLKHDQSALDEYTKRQMRSYEDETPPLDRTQPPPG